MAKNVKLPRCSKHLSKDHEDRTLQILTTIGIGEELFSVPHVDTTGNHCLRVLTSTGVILCKDERDGTTIITMFAATIAQAKEMYYKRYQVDRIPEHMKRTILNNKGKRGL